MNSIRFLTRCVLPIFLALCALPAALADQVISINFSTATLTLVDEYGTTLLSTPVVLPGRDFYTLPVTGIVTSARMGPSWAPTANTRAAHPGKYKASYGPYEKGNAMGHCKITIAFASDEPILQTVRIHGNAKSADLGGRYSRGCVRIPDDVCSQLISLVNMSQDGTRVQFQK